MHQLIFNDKKTYDDWDLYLLSYEIGDADPKEIWVDVPGGNGKLDLTEALTGEVAYNNRKFEAEFFIEGGTDKWTETLEKVRAFVNGQKLTLKEPLDKNYHYIGRFKTSFSAPTGTTNSFTITGTLEPFKIKNQVTTKTFEIGSAGTSVISVPNSRKRVVPEIKTTGEVKITKGVNSVSLSVGTHKNTNIILEEGNNRIEVKGSPGVIVTFSYQEGAL